MKKKKEDWAIEGLGGAIDERTPGNRIARSEKGIYIFTVELRQRKTGIEEFLRGIQLLVWRRNDLKK